MDFLNSLADAVHVKAPQPPAGKADANQPDQALPSPDRSAFRDMLAKKRADVSQNAEDAPAGQPADGEPADSGDETGLPTAEQMTLAAMAMAQLNFNAPQELPQQPVQQAVGMTVATDAVEPAVTPVETDGGAVPSTLPAQVEAQPEAQAEQKGAFHEAAATAEAAVKPQEESAPQAEAEPVAAEPARKAQDRHDTEVDVDASAEPESRPVFNDVKNPPVKVGDGMEPEVKNEPVAKQVLSPVNEALARGDSTVQISLQPESLGSVTVKLTRSEDGALHVLLQADTLRSQSILERSAASLQAMLADKNQGAVQVQVERQQQSQEGHQSPYDQGQNQSGRENPQQQPRQRQQTEDFMQQLRLGLVPVESEAS